MTQQSVTICVRIDSILINNRVVL